MLSRLAISRLALLFSGFAPLLISVFSELTCSNPAPRWDHLSGAQIKGIQVAILPIGSVEYHGPHLPLGTDAILSETITKMALEGLSNVALLPTLHYGASFEHVKKPGTLPIDDHKFVKLLDDIIDGIVNAGVEKIIIVNGHGGQTPHAQIVIRRARDRHLALVVLFEVQACLSEAYASFPEIYNASEAQHDIHAGFIETSVMLHISPSLVDVTKLEYFRPTWKAGGPFGPFGSVVSYGWHWDDLHTDEAVENSVEATAEIGEKLFAVCVKKLRNVTTSIEEVTITFFLRPHS